MPLYKEATYYRDGVVLAGLALTTLALFIGATGYFWSESTDATFAAAYLALGVVVGFCFYRLARARYRLKITEKNIKVKLDGTRQVREEIPLSDVIAVEPVKQQAAARYRGANLGGFSRFYSLSGYVGLRVKTKDQKEYFFGCKQPNAVAKIVRQAAAL